MSEIRVFICYAHESEEHCEKVLELAQTLMTDGVQTELDRFIEHPREGWPLWMATNLREASRVLMICSPSFYRRVTRQESAGVGYGCQWEGSMIYNEIYGGQAGGDKYIPILFDEGDVNCIPEPVRGFTRYALKSFSLSDPEYMTLYRYLTNRPLVTRVALGEIKPVGQLEMYGRERTLARSKKASPRRLRGEDYSRFAARAYLHRARIADPGQDFQEIADLTKKAFELDGTLQMAREMHVWALARLERIEEVVAVSQEMIAEGFATDFIRFHLVSALISLGNFEQAKAELCIGLIEFPESQYLLATRVLRDEFEVDEMDRLATLRKLVGIKPPDNTVQRFASYYFLKVGEPASAIAAGQRLTAENPTFESYDLQGKGFLKLGDFELAVEAFERALSQEATPELRKAMAESTLELARCFAALNRETEALARIRSAIQQDIGVADSGLDFSEFKQLESNPTFVQLRQIYHSRTEDSSLPTQ